ERIDAARVERDLQPAEALLHLFVDEQGHSRATLAERGGRSQKGYTTRAVPPPETKENEAGPPLETLVGSVFVRVPDDVAAERAAGAEAMLVEAPCAIHAAHLDHAGVHEQAHGLRRPQGTPASLCRVRHSMSRRVTRVTRV